MNGDHFMRKLALSERVLMSVEKPARYIGNELNAVMKDKDDVKVRFVMCFPDVYEIGMSHLGIQILYHMFNEMEDVWCERVYSPWPDLDKIMRRENIPLFALESQDPVRDFDFLGITLQYEMCYTNILQILDLSRIPLFSNERGENDPIVIGGGPCAYNPEPIADFFDLFYIGEGEVMYRKLLDVYESSRENHLTRREFLEKAAAVPGIYVPSLYEVTYHEDGTIEDFSPKKDTVPGRIRKQAVMDLSDAVYPMKPIVPFIRATQDRVVLELQRGCIRGCRFCQAGYIYRPVRERSLETLESFGGKMLANTGYDEITLSSLSSSDYRNLGEIVDFLREDCMEGRINIELPSLRIDAFALRVMEKIQDVHKGSLTFAPEAGTQRMRDVINKGLTEEDILNGAEKAFHSGWNKVKLYFMLGLPTEQNEDVLGIPQLAGKIAELYYQIPKEERQGRCTINTSTSFFIPKPFTPFQWSRMISEEECCEKAGEVREAFRKETRWKNLKYQYHSPDVSVLEGIFARGDRKLSALLLTAYRKGCIFDAWTECFNKAGWDEAIKETGISVSFYNRERRLDEKLPWDFIDIGVTKEHMLREWKKALEGCVTPNCREKCAGCGAAVFGGGVCFEGKN